MSPCKNLPIFFLCHLLLLMLLKAYSKCQQTYPCRNFSIEFPFTDYNYPDCGLFPVNCDFKHQNPRVSLGGEYPFDLLQKLSANKFFIHDSVLAKYLYSKSCFSFLNVSLPQSPFVTFTFSPNLTSFGCLNPSKAIQNNFSRYENRSCGIWTIYYKTPATHHVPAFDHYLPRDCVMNQLPIKSVQEYSGDLFNLLTPNFTLEWNVSKACHECYRRGGQCLANNRNEFYCTSRSPPGNTKVKKILLIGGMIIAALASTFIIVFIFNRRKRAKAKHEYEKDIELFLKNNGNLAPIRYRYSSIKKMTNSFSENLMIVGLWCIQTNPKDRPSMTKVVEMLEGKLGSLEVPPKPYLYSPPRSAPSISVSESL